MPDNREMDLSKKLPKILVLSDGCISYAHGTGAVLIRQLTNYPSDKIFHAYRNKRGEPFYERSLEIHYSLDDKKSIDFAIKQLKSELDKYRFKPGLIYAIFNSAVGLKFLETFVQTFKTGIPLIQYFQDYFPGLGEIAPIIEKLKPNLKEIWVLTEEMAQSMRPLLKSPVHVISNRFCKIPQNYKKKHTGKIDAKFSVIIFGNIWHPHVIAEIKDVWSYIKNIFPNISSIKWYAHNSSVDYVKEAGIKFQPEIKYEGFLSVNESGFYNFLATFDMALIPFNIEASPKNVYAKFSFPSRITELAAVGLPMFFMASPGTPIQRCVEEKNIGVCSSPSNIPVFKENVLSFIKDKKLRERCGYNARKLAETEFDLLNHQEFLYNKFADLVKTKIKGLV